ncbi:dTDP-fucopyranose mutase [Mucor velutinosus]|uniref:dTDP-fucopyranose mutase n=1 Tax=Mucor velutinosus TaxID=708070 RepID=A0AAN7HWK9_9FUNG|nr:dTDP-fucopyranose mutase [Mucor velutinosus]
MDPNTVKKIAKDYSYQYVCQGDPIWPNDLTIPSGFLEDAIKNRVDQECESVYKCLEHILNQYEGEHELHHAFDVRRLPIPRLFSILPTPSVHWRSLAISANALSVFVKNPLPRGYANQLRLFYQVFNFKLLGYSSIEELMPNGENDVLFGNIVRSDGFCVDFLFYKRTSGTADEISTVNHDLGIKDFTIEEVTQLYRPSFLDPGRKTVFTAAIGLDPDVHQVRRCTTKEYYHLTGSTVYAKKLQQEKDTAGITAIESAIPSAKTARNTQFLRYVDYILANMDTLFTFYGFSTAKHRFNLYQGKQRAPDMMVNMLLNGGAKYNKKKRFKKEEQKTKTT